MKYKSVHSCRFVHHVKLHCIMTTLNKLFETEFERGELEKGQNQFIPVLRIKYKLDSKLARSSQIALCNENEFDIAINQASQKKCTALRFT